MQILAWPSWPLGFKMELRFQEPALSCCGSPFPVETTELERREMMQAFIRISQQVSSRGVVEGVRSSAYVNLPVSSVSVFFLAQ